MKKHLTIALSDANYYRDMKKFIYIVVVFLTLNAAQADTLKVPPNAIETSCLQEFKNLDTRFYQYFILRLDNTTREKLGPPNSEGMIGMLLGEYWKRTGLVYVKVGNEIKRLVSDVAFFPENDGAVSGMEGYRYGTAGTLGGYGVFLEYPDKESLNNAIFDEILGCFILN